MTDSILARMDDVWKKFSLRKDRHGTLAKGIKELFLRKKAEQFWAVKGVSFEVHRGESLGIIGANGAGKSTILKMLMRILRPTRGTVEMHGLVTGLIELGAGFHPDFTGRENVFINGAVLGFPRRFLDQKFEEIVDFAGLKEFIDVPVKYYSSGMHARLGFSLATAVNPELLIVDEVLAVGDEDFQRKATERIQTMRRDGMGIIFVSHDLRSVERICDRAIFLKKGNVEGEGNATEIAALYKSSVDIPV